VKPEGWKRRREFQAFSDTSRAKRRARPTEKAPFDLRKIHFDLKGAAGRRLVHPPSLHLQQLQSAHKATRKSPSSSKPQLKCSLGLPPPPSLRPTPILVAPPPRAPAYVRSSRWRAPTTPAQRPPGRSPSSAPGSGERALFPSPSLGCERVLVRVCAFEAFDEMVLGWGALCLCAAGSRRRTGSGRAA